MKIGNKILKIRELKNISPKDMADRLNITTSGYQKIERDEVSINMERLEEISSIFEMRPEDVLTFDEKVVFNNYNGTNYNHHNVGTSNIHYVSEEMKKLYEENARLQEERSTALKEMVELQKSLIARLEKENDSLKGK